MIKCVDIFELAIDGARDKLGDAIELNNGKYNILKLCCEIIDNFKEEQEIEEFSVEVDEETLEIIISFKSFEINIDIKDHSLCEVLRYTSRYGFYAADKENLLTKLIFPGIWEKI